MKVLLEISANYEGLVKVGQTGSDFQINETGQFVKKEKCGFFCTIVCSFLCQCISKEGSQATMQ